MGENHEVEGREKTSDFGKQRNARGQSCPGRAQTYRHSQNEVTIEKKLKLTASPSSDTMRAECMQSMDVSTADALRYEPYNG